MTTPITPVPAIVQKWIARARYLRWADALGAWLVLWIVVSLLLPGAPARWMLALSSALVLLGCVIHPVRRRWRPVSGYTGFVVSRKLRPGDHAWYVRTDRADRVLVTARRGLRLTIALPGLDAAEGMSVRCTRVFVLPTGAGQAGPGVR